MLRSNLRIGGSEYLKVASSQPFRALTGDPEPYLQKPVPIGLQYELH